MDSPSFYLGSRLGITEFQAEVHNLTENRTRHARGPVQPTVPLHLLSTTVQALIQIWVVNLTGEK